MTAAENRRRLAELRSIEQDRSGNQAIALHNSAELLHAAKLRPKLGRDVDRRSSGRRLGRLEFGGPK